MENQKNNTKTIIRIVNTFFIIAFVIVLAVVGWLLYNELYPNDEIIVKTIASDDTGINWDRLREMNPDIVGWIKIDDTRIDSPVVQTTDNVKYLNTNFQGDWDERGTLFLDCDYHWDGTAKNSVIYGHSIFREGSGIHVMFDDLHNYIDSENPEDYYQKHKIIEYDRPPDKGGNAKYQIISVFECESITDYVKMYFGSEQEFVDYYTNLVGMSAVKTYATIAPGEEILTLSTCTEKVQFNDGRLVVIAKRLHFGYEGGTQN